MNSLLVDLFNFLNKKKITYAVLRNYQSLPFDLGGSDLDIWVKSSDVSYFISAVEKVANCNDASLVSFLPDRFCPKLCILNLNNGIQMDVFIGGITYQNLVMFPETVIMNNLAYYGEICHLDDKLSNLLAYLKEVINNKQCEIKYVQSLREDPSAYSKAYLKNNLPLFSDRFIECLTSALNKQTLQDEAYMIGTLGRKCLNCRNVIFHKLKKIVRLTNYPGYVIAVEGTDGSGKSTVIDVITPWLEEAFHKGVVYNHLRPNVIPDLGVLLGKKEATKDNEKPLVNSTPHAQKPSGILGSIVRWGYYMIDYTVGYMWHVWPKVATKSKVFIFDRYYYEYYLDQKRSRTNLPQWVIRLGELFLPNPDLILCLGGDPEKIYARKPETSLEEVIRQTKVLQEFCNRRKNAVWINTTIRPEESVMLAKKAILDIMKKRFGKKRLS